MKFAAVIDVGHGPETLKQAVSTQLLLLERLGTRLDSIRLAAPRLFDVAYASALAEKPDVLVVAGCARSARRAGQLAYEQKAPVIFLPGLNASDWAAGLWGSLNLDEAIAALARSEIKRVRLTVGLAGAHVFLNDARCGLLPFVPELRRDISDSEGFSEGWHAVRRAVDAGYCLLRRGVEFTPQGDQSRRASALVLRASGNVQTGSVSDSHFPVLSATAFNYGPLGYLLGVARGCTGGEWQGGREEHFVCSEVDLHTQYGAWILLDGEPLRLRGGTGVQLIAGGLETCMFAPGLQIARGNAKRAARLPYGQVGDTGRSWNFRGHSSVAIPESRDNGETASRKQV